jgi:hypothetical protein
VGPTSVEDEDAYEGEGARQRRGKYKQDVEREVDRIKVKVSSTFGTGTLLTVY